jgi:prophage regulatory protein
MKILSFRDLRDRGIPWTRQHVHRLVKTGNFPAPFKIGGKTNAWDEGEIDEYLKGRLARRNEAQMKMASSG